MSSLEHMDDGMRRKIVDGLKTRQSQAPVTTEFNVTSSVVCNFWEQFQDTASIPRRARQVKAEDEYLDFWAHYDTIIC
ncbi:hypothetical protein TNIN_426901 [Trichonephila inaurata madagascariensis]|uniref:Uncharacterized protein n=1 Tax=Trichonephila inaurata madagascariensis TaxID=2747483 RepID=A0A8X6MB65_9ARAC|nr:hypothetical protein TNIN_426901 [Trichonephila inaurata madagascariensis]